MTSCTVGNYKLIDKLGEGGMGAVYKGVDLMVEREVAIKMLRPEIARQPEIVERFRAEAVALAKLNHPNIATLYSFFREGDEYFMVMEFVLGRTLESIIRDFPPIRVEQALPILSQVLAAVEHAHSYGILHRDIKPANIMLTASGQVKVTDFGIARVLGTTRMTREGLICGTLQYLAPERIRGQEADIRSDLYSTGVVLYEMLSGRLPFERDTDYELMRAHLEATPPSFASLGLSVSPEVETIVSKALAKIPEQRFGTAAEFRSALSGVAGTHATEPNTTEPNALTAGAANIAAPALRPAEVSATVNDVSSTPTPAVSTATPRWKLYAAVTIVAVLIALTVAFSWSRKHGAIEATKPAPAPVTARPSTPAVPPQAGGQLDAAPASLPPERRANIQENLKEVPASQGQAASPSITTEKARPSGMSTPAQRRKAALAALDKGAAATPGVVKKKTEKERDPRSTSLKALEK